MIINKPFKKLNLKFQFSFMTETVQSNSFFGFVLIMEVPLAAETKKKKPTIHDIPNIAAKGSKVKENIEFIKSK